MELRKRTEDHSPQWQARVDLFRDIEAALGEDPAGEKSQGLAARWQAQIEEARSVGRVVATAGVARLLPLADGSIKLDELRTVRKVRQFSGSGRQMANHTV